LGSQLCRRFLLTFFFVAFLAAARFAALPFDALAVRADTMNIFAMHGMQFPNYPSHRVAALE
jgi:hypothetical protein